MKLPKLKQVELIVAGLQKAEELVEQYMPKDTFTEAERDAFRSVAFDIVNKVAPMERDDAINYLKDAEREKRDAKEIYRRSIENE
tara:strand:+ start:1519 stop:1773 length:255 start_codon:yes stop_codon:yes gene_type:complete